MAQVEKDLWLLIISYYLNIKRIRLTSFFFCKMLIININITIIIQSFNSIIIIQFNSTYFFVLYSSAKISKFSARLPPNACVQLLSSIIVKPVGQLMSNYWTQRTIIQSCNSKNKQSWNCISNSISKNKFGPGLNKQPNRWFDQTILMLKI